MAATIRFTLTAADDTISETDGRKILKIELTANCASGLETALKNELLKLEAENVSADNGLVNFTADNSRIPEFNMSLRTADRVFIRIASFTASSFEELFQNTSAIDWQNYIPADGAFPVTGKSVHSQLHSVPGCQSIIKKAAAEKLKKAYKTGTLPESAGVYRIHFSILKDNAVLYLDTTGEGLSRRGYRLKTVEAPLRETMAAGLVMLSFWNPERYMIDPYCGSGTIAIEAALIGKNIPPGLNRSFVSENWTSLISKEDWKEARKKGRDGIRDIRMMITGSDADPSAVSAASENAQRVGVLSDIRFECRKAEDVWIDREYGIVITNPPYGIRMCEKTHTHFPNRLLGRIFSGKSGWSVFVLTTDEDFEKYYGKNSDRKRKLQNGGLKVWFYQYHGRKPD